MIEYAEKGYGLHRAVIAAGHSLVNVDGVWISSDDAAVQAIIDGFTLDDARAGVVAEIEAKAREYFDAAVAGASPAEMAAWSTLRTEAAAFQESGLESDCPYIVAEAQVRGVTVAVLVQRVLYNALGFENLRAQIAGVSGRHKDAVRLLATFQAIATYDYSTGWPTGA